MKHLKSFLAFAMFSFLLVSCTQDTETVDASLDLTANETVDLTTIINPDTARAAAQFDNTTNGIYKGVFVSTDISYHGVLTVNLANDSQYNAILEYGDDQNQRLGFVRVNNDASSISNVIEFRGKNAGFTLDVSDYALPVVTEASIGGQGAQVKVLKETSGNQVRAVLGTFVQSDDPTFTGSWDLMSSGTRVVTVPTGLPAPTTIDVTVNNISDVAVTVDGVLFSDIVMEDFIVPNVCGAPLPIGNQAPFYSGMQTIGGFPINEYAAATQTSTFVVGDPAATWNLVYSGYQGGLYYDADCNVIAGGTWSWKGRTGTITLD